jgi:cell wall-associated NlpC family hydrolase
LVDDGQVSRHRLLVVVLSIGVLVWLTPGLASAASSRSAQNPSPADLAQLNTTSLTAAALAIEGQALRSGAMTETPITWSPAAILLDSADALMQLAITDDPTLAPKNTTAIMGPVPFDITHHLHKQPAHYRHKSTHTLLPFTAAVPDGGSRGLGHDRTHNGARPAPYQRPDGIFVDPTLPEVAAPTVGMVAVRASLQELGQPYVWGGGGPSTFDCSGLVQWAYAKAGLFLAHHAASQWNEGRLIPGRDILPGDLLLFGRPIEHVGIYLGAGWMINAPYTGQYVNIMPMQSGVAGVVRP